MTGTPLGQSSLQQYTDPLGQNGLSNKTPPGEGEIPQARRERLTQTPNIHPLQVDLLMSLRSQRLRCWHPLRCQMTTPCPTGCSQRDCTTMISLSVKIKALGDGHFLMTLACRTVQHRCASDSKQLESVGWCVAWPMCCPT
jgi:hypothetical protein